MRIDHDFWKCHQEEKHKFQAARLTQSYAPKLPRPTQGRPLSTQEGTSLPDKMPRDSFQGLLLQTSSPSHTEPTLSAASSILGPDGQLTPTKHQHHMNLGLCMCCGQSRHLARSCPKQVFWPSRVVEVCVSHIDIPADPLEVSKNNLVATSLPGELTAWDYPGNHCYTWVQQHSLVWNPYKLCSQPLLSQCPSMPW